MMPAEARVQCSIWRDPDVLALPSGWPKFLYLFLFTQPDISMCGRLALEESYWASVLAPEATPELVRDWLGLLDSRRFVVVDSAANELLVRARIRRDNVIGNPKLTKPLIRACEDLRSGKLRAAVAAELRRCQREGLVPPRSEGQIEALAASMERTSGFSIAPLFEASPQVDDPSDDSRCESSDGSRGIGGRGKGFRSRGGPGGELALFGSNVPTAKLGTDDDPGWVRFWAVYPRKVSKGDARTAWRNAVAGRKDRLGTDPEIIIKGAEAYARARDGQEPKYTCHPATWLNRERWNDDPAALAASSLPKADQNTLRGLALSDEYRAQGD